MIGQKKSAKARAADFLPTLHRDTKAKPGKPVKPGENHARSARCLCWPCGARCYQARLTFSSILKMPLGERTKRRLNALPRQRRSRVLRRVRLISAMMISGLCMTGQRTCRPVKYSVNPVFYLENLFRHKKSMKTAGDCWPGRGCLRLVAPPARRTIMIAI